MSSIMGRCLLFYILLATIPAVGSYDFLINNVRNIKKRNVADANTVGIDMHSMNIDSHITSRFAHNVITSRAINLGNVSKEAFFDVELPKTAFITSFTMTIDGMTYPGTIKEKEAAQKQYQQAVSKGQTAGLVRASGRKTEKFTVSVNIASSSEVVFELAFEELLKRRFGYYEMFINVNPKQIVKNFEIEVNIFEPQGISYLEAEGSFITNDLLPVLQKSFSGKKGHVSFKPTLDQQRTCVDCLTTLLNGDFIVKYDVNRETSGNIQIVNGYFVHFFAPKNILRLSKNIVFIIDVSGSMLGRKLKQTKEALLKILEDIKEEDYINFVLFWGDVHKWKDTLIKATPENLAEARRYVQQIAIDGWTNLNAGLMTGIELLNEAHKNGSLPERSASLIIMLTDGRPNKGEVNTDIILENVRNAIQGKYPLYNLGFGYDVDYASLEKMASENNGLARRIYEDSDSALQLQGFYDEVANPLLTEVELQYPENAISDLTQNHFKHYYDGSEIVVAGRIIDDVLNSITADVKAHGAEDDLTFSEQSDINETAKAFEEQKYIFGNHTERLWAYLTIQQLLEKRNSAKGDEKANLTAKVLEMSLKYKFVTPLTSLVVTKPEDNTDKAVLADKPLEAEAAPAVSAYPSYNPPSYSHTYTSVDGDPHFIIDIPQKEDHLCFNIYEDPGKILNLIRDPSTGITVNGQLIGNKQSRNDVQPQNSYIGRLGILSEELNLKLEVTPEKIILYNGTKQMTFTWLDEVTLLRPTLTFKIIRKKSLEVSVGEGATFVIVLHRAWRRNPKHGDFLGLYTLDSHRLSEHTHGLLEKLPRYKMNVSVIASYYNYPLENNITPNERCQFFHPINFTILEVHPGSTPEKPDATMLVKNHQLTVTRGWQKDYTEDSKHGKNVPCWFIHNNGEGLIDGTYTDYIVSNLF